jgi:hypothetical protein
VGEAEEEAEGNHAMFLEPEGAGAPPRVLCVLFQLQCAVTW